ncbi:hypothetical protein KM043_017582 [Ampulex compressa]|nr:hypothetical protein KM043_017582 [Ampulex compressa]
MSRLIVSNLPKTITSDKLKELFSQKGLVTDIQLKYTKERKFRRFAFIGFTTEEEASAAREYFDKSCIDTSKISVKNCACLGDVSKPKSWSKYSSDSSYNNTETNKGTNKETESDEKKNITKNTDRRSKDKKRKDDKVKELLEKHKDDPLFAEFLESHSENSLKRIWSNDAAATMNANRTDGDNADDSKETKQGKEEETEKVADTVISDLEYMKVLKKKQQGPKEEKLKQQKSELQHGSVKFFTVKIRGLGYNHKKKHIKDFFKPLKPASIRVPPKIKGIAYVGFKTEQHMKKALLKNKSFMDGKQLFVMKYEKSENATSISNNYENNTVIKWRTQEEALKDEESIAESGRIFIRNLAYITTEEDIRQLFEKYGPLTEVNLPVDRVTRKPKGFGTVTFLLPEHAMKAYSELDGSILNGRMLHVLPGKAKSNLLDQLNEGELTYKQKKDLQNKATAGSSHNWNTLFLGQNAVAVAIASNYNTTKEKVLADGSKGLSAAVKLALGETQLVQDTRNFLEENEVCLDAFNQAPKKRSKTVILVKNLPGETSVHEIRSIFEQFGELGRFVMPPTGITALVEFLEPSEARTAFTKLAYTKYKHLPLYLEWAPDNSFTSPTEVSNQHNRDNSEKKGKTQEKIKEEQEQSINKSNIKYESVKDKEESEDEDEPELDTTLFVKNLNFSTTADQLKAYFRKCGPIHYVTVATKKDSKNLGNRMSMGYGFVRYKKKRDAERALKTLQMTVLADKTLELKRSERTLVSDVKTMRKVSKVTTQTGTKILVRNVPFQASMEEITELFKAFGEIKAVRLPKKLVGMEKHRGFAFVEYYTKSEAKKAFKALCQSTHLYGRRLVVEWAQKEEGIEEIRKRTAKHFHEEIFTFIMMNNQAKSCYLRSEDKSLHNIYLPNNTPVFIGRSPVTNITDTKCSRQQVRLYADYSKRVVNIQQIGTRSCGFNGFQTQKGDKLIARHNDRLEILYGKHVYYIEFNPSPKTYQKSISKKRSYELDLGERQEEDLRKMQKLEYNNVDDKLNDAIEESSNAVNPAELILISTTNTASISVEPATKSLWEEIANGDLLIYTPVNLQHSKKIAAYDMDGTLITTKSGLVFPKSCDDWQILYPSVPQDWSSHSVGNSIYRKPSVGMWETLEKSKNGGLMIERTNSFYIGDAAGRPKNWAPGKKKDHSLVDRLMALNLDLKFQTPEEHFLGHKVASFVMPMFNPKNVPKDGALCSPPETKLTIKQQEVILMVGCPGSGKSHFVKFHLKDYEYVNRDTLGTWQKCVEIMQQCFVHGKKVVIDNTNPNPKTRARYIDVAKEYKIPVRCFIMATNAEHSKHNNKFRKLTDPNHAKINDMLINSYLKSYVSPTLDEGFEEIVYVNFIAKFHTKEDQRLYEMYLLEN